MYRNLMYFGQSRFRTAYDIDTIVWPEGLLTQDIFRVVSVPEALDVEYFAKGKVKLFEYRIKEDSIILDKRVMDCEFPKNVLIVGITRENELFIPQGSTVIELNDKVVIMGTDHALDLLAARIFRKNISIRKAVVIGGGSVGFLFPEQLESAGICAGSAGGGIKVVRILFWAKYLRREITQIIHPQIVKPIKLDLKTVHSDIQQQIIGFLLFYLLIMIISALAVTAIEGNGVIGLVGTAATLGNIGPGFGEIGPMVSFGALSLPTKLIFIVNMAVGRLEIIPFLAMFHPDFWRFQ
ncbi:MAG: potassium transporter TrkG [Desulfocapsaceae bacterium]